jgi:glycosyltransferase involved in cell wall biosynthesis
LLDEQAPGATLVERELNAGKGGAVMTGLRAALAQGYSHALQIDADGQHDVNDIPRFVETGGASPGSLICGQPVFDESISSLRYYGRFLTISLNWLETLSREIKDGLCGFRLYPLADVVSIIDRSSPGTRMAFDPEILVRAVWSGIPLVYIPVEVRYPESGRSHFHYLRDNVEITWMHTRLIAGMLLRSPMLLLRRLRGAQES